jgi:hypothetical protein
MKNNITIGIGALGLLCTIAGGYYYWVAMQIAMQFAYAQTDGSLNKQAWFWFMTCCVVIALLLTSGIAYFISRRHKRGLSAA